MLSIILCNSISIHQPWDVLVAYFHIRKYGILEVSRSVFSIAPHHRQHAGTLRSQKFLSVRIWHKCMRRFVGWELLMTQVKSLACNLSFSFYKWLYLKLRFLQKHSLLIYFMSVVHHKSSCMWLPLPHRPQSLNIPLGRKMTTILYPNPQ